MFNLVNEFGGQNAVSKSGHLIELKRRRTFETNKEKEISESLNLICSFICTLNERIPKNLKA